MTPRVVGVFPLEARARRRRLFDALEAAFPLRFAGRALADQVVLPGGGAVLVPHQLEAKACEQVFHQLVAGRGNVGSP